MKASLVKHIAEQKHKDWIGFGGMRLYTGLRDERGNENLTFAVSLFYKHKHTLLCIHLRDT